MIITFATQKGGTGKTTLATAFSNYLSTITNRNIHVYDYDYQLSFYRKWQDDNNDPNMKHPKIYDVHIVGNENKKFSLEELFEMKDSDDIHLFDLAGTIDAQYTELLIYNDFIIIPFEYSEFSAKSTLEFINFLGLIESEGERIFIRSKYDKGFKYPNQIGMDNEIVKYGTLLKNSVFKRNCLQTINTRKLTYEQKYAVQKPFDEIIKFINATLEITI